jgi:hypothetical protein
MLEYVPCHQKTQLQLIASAAPKALLTCLIGRIVASGTGAKEGPAPHS